MPNRFYQEEDRDRTPSRWEQYVNWRAEVHRRTLSESGGRLYATIPAWMIPGGKATEAGKKAASYMKSALVAVGTGVGGLFVGLSKDFKEVVVGNVKKRARAKARSLADGNPSVEFCIDVLDWLNNKNATLEADLLAQFREVSNGTADRLRDNILSKYDAGAAKAVESFSRVPLGDWIFDADVARDCRARLLLRLNEKIEAAQANADILKAARTAKETYQAEISEAQAALAKAQNLAAQKAISRKYSSQSTSALRRTLDNLNTDLGGGTPSSVRGTRADKERAKNEIEAILAKRAEMP
jgi:hypothetical protein